MMDCDKLVKALRICSSELNCGDCPLLYRDSCSSDELMADAADAIEALQAQLPKLGEWKTTRPDAPMFGFYYCSICGRKRTSPQDNYCPNCGAKMEVQDG